MDRWRGVSPERVPHGPSEVMAVQTASALMAGLSSATLTNGLDVVKTRLQVAACPFRVCECRRCLKGSQVARYCYLASIVAQPAKQASAPGRLHQGLCSFRILLSPASFHVLLLIGANGSWHHIMRGLSKERDLLWTQTAKYVFLEVLPVGNLGIACISGSARTA